MVEPLGPPPAGVIHHVLPAPGSALGLGAHEGSSTLPPVGARDEGV